ncbi:ATP-binding protein [Legionella worsleiensis]|uniref:ATP-binding protein n=1 Tax=Legionella worsleiensis TaxID=45076 RepID=UPI00072FCA62|nr:ATP-binding protein [Legionella worsleiensis]
MASQVAYNKEWTKNLNQNPGCEQPGYITASYRALWQWKTYLACNLGHSTCLKGLQILNYRLSRLFISLAKAKADCTYHKELAALSQTRLLIIDDWGNGANNSGSTK